MPGKGFVGPAVLLALLTLASRVLGVIRESVFGYYFGTSQTLSAFRIAFQIPNLTRRLFGEGALSSAMIPVLTETLRNQGEERSRQFVGSVITLMLTVLGGALVLAEAGILLWRWRHPSLTLDLTAIMLPYAAMICTVAVISSVLNVRGHFAVPAAAPITLNLANIAALYFGARYLNLSELPLIYLVCLSVLAAGLYQLVLVAAALRRASFVPPLSTSWRDPQVVKVMKLMGPMVLGLSAVQISTLADTLLAWFFIFDAKGERSGPAVLGFAQVLYQLPLGVFGISIATAIFPVLSARAAAEDRTGLARTFEQGLRLSLFIALPSAVGMIVIARPLVKLLLERGEFGPSDTNRVAGTLIFYSLGIAAYFAQHVVVRTYYALHDSRAPARAAAATVVVNFAINLWLVQVMQERGLALSTAVCSTLQVLWLLRLLRRRLPEIKWNEVAGGLVRMAAAAMVMGAALIAGQNSGVAQHLDSGSSVALSLLVGALVAAGAAIYGIATYVLKLPELRTFTKILRRP